MTFISKKLHKNTSVRNNRFVSCGSRSTKGSFLLFPDKKNIIEEKNEDVVSEKKVKNSSKQKNNDNNKTEITTENVDNREQNQ